MSTAREIAYRLDPALWMREVQGMNPAGWQETFLRAPEGASILALTSRQVGKTTTLAMAIAHCMICKPGSLSVIGAPAQRQSGEAIRLVKAATLKAGAELRTDNVYNLELTNGSRVLALPGSDDSIRGLTVNGWIGADEAARLSPELIAALRPMRARTNGRLAMLSTAWSRTDPFWSAWESGGDWIRLKATVDEDPTLFRAEFLAQERANLGEESYRREYLGIPAGTHMSPFTWELYDSATTAPVHPAAWKIMKPNIIAHDVGHRRDRSTAVVGGKSMFAPELCFLAAFEELAQGLSGSARVEALAKVDRRYGCLSLIIVDVSFDPTYAELLYERFGARVIGLKITSAGDGMNVEHWQFKTGAMRVYTIGRTYLLDLLHREMLGDKVRILAGPESVRAYAQLTSLEMEFNQNRIVYGCPSGLHDDLAISMAMQVWAAQHPHLSFWTRALEPRRPWTKQPPVSAKGWT